MSPQVLLLIVKHNCPYLYSPSSICTYILEAICIDNGAIPEPETCMTVRDANLLCSVLQLDTARKQACIGLPPPALDFTGHTKFYMA